MPARSGQMKVLYPFSKVFSMMWEKIMSWGIVESIINQNVLDRKIRQSIDQSTAQNIIDSAKTSILSILFSLLLTSQDALFRLYAAWLADVFALPVLGFLYIFPCHIWASPVSLDLEQDLYACIDFARSAVLIPVPAVLLLVLALLSLVVGSGQGIFRLAHPTNNLL